jgi:hypothetical protein
MAPEPGAATSKPEDTRAAASAGPYPGLWRHCRSKKLLDALTGDPDEPRRQIEVDVIFADPLLWRDSREAREGGWDPIDLDGVILAERTIG